MNQYERELHDCERCERCGKKLKRGTQKYLELNARTGEWQREGSVDDADSQGSFPFGPDCQRTVLKNDGRQDW